MNKNIVIALVIIILIGLGVWYYNSSHGTSTVYENQQNTDTTQTNTTTGTTAKKNTFQSIFTQVGNYQCSYEQASSSARSSSVVYIADGKMHGEFRTTTGAATKADIMIYSGGVLYTWKEGATTGNKASISSLAQLPQVIPTDLTSGAILGASNDNVSWDCHDWIKDTKMFTLPTYVTFK